MRPLARTGTVQHLPSSTLVRADGWYFFAVLIPSGQHSPNDGDPGNLSDDYDTYQNRTFRVTNGEISSYSGTHIQDILKLLVSHEIDVGLQGKGRGCWTAFGYVLARRQSKVIALHDCDVLSYNREYLARLCYPIANPNLGYEFCKGYYSRVTDRLRIGVDAQRLVRRELRVFHRLPKVRRVR